MSLYWLCYHPYLTALPSIARKSILLERRPPMNKWAVIVVIALQSTAALGDDYKEATEAAYCIGVYQSDIEGLRRMEKDPKNADTHDVEMTQFRKQAFVEGAIKRGIIDVGTASKMKAVGYADGKSCWQR